METHDTPYIGNRGDALELLDELLERTRLEQAVREALEVLRDTLEREIVYCINEKFRPYTGGAFFHGKERFYGKQKTKRRHIPARRENGMKVLTATKKTGMFVSCSEKEGLKLYSCDALPCIGGHQEWHIQDDVRTYAGKRESGV